MQGSAIFNGTVLRQSNQAGASPTVVSAVRQASLSTGVDFYYLMEKAAVESGFNTNPKAANSSATGEAINSPESTWLNMVAQHGAAHGLGALASEITVGADGTPTVANAADRQKILDLRTDPTVAAAMAAELAKDNKAQLQATIGGQIGGTELYLAHFLGAGGAEKFLTAYRQNPNETAATVLPDAAARQSRRLHRCGQRRTSHVGTDPMTGSPPISAARSLPRQRQRQQHQRHPQYQYRHHQHLDFQPGSDRPRDPRRRRAVPVIALRHPDASLAQHYRRRPAKRRSKKLAGPIIPAAASAGFKPERYFPAPPGDDGGCRNMQDERLISLA